MPYIGGTPTANFTDIPVVERFNGNNSTTSFTLSRTVGADEDILVSVDGVIQDTNKYSVSGTSLSFSTAPSTGTGNIFVNFLGISIATVSPPTANRSSFIGGGMFRVNDKTVGANVTIGGAENASATGPITVNSSVTLQVEDGGTLVII
jgi:hypothetical protein